MGLASHSARADWVQPLTSDIQCGAPSSLFTLRFSLYFFHARRRRLFALRSSLFAFRYISSLPAAGAFSLFTLRSSLYFFLARRRRLFALRSSLFAIFLPRPPQAPFHSSLFTLPSSYVTCIRYKPCAGAAMPAFFRFFSAMTWANFVTSHWPLPTFTRQPTRFRTIR